MSGSIFSAECEANLRRAHVEAKRSLRQQKRDFGARDPAQVIHDIRMAGWLAERIRVEGPTMSDERLCAMRTHLLRKLAQAEIAVTEILDSPAPAARCSR